MKTMQGGGGGGGGGAAQAGQVVVQMEPKVAAAGDATKSPDLLECSSPQHSFKAGDRRPPPPSTTAAAKPRSILRSPTIAVKPKSRFVELNYPPPPKSVAFDDTATAGAGAATTTSSASKRMSYDDGDSDSDWDEWKKENVAAAAEQEVEEKNRKRRSKVKWRAVVESAAFMVITACLVSALTVPSLKRAALWGLAPWKWCVLVLVVFSGRLVAEWLVFFLVFLIERKFMLRGKIVYFVYGLRRSVQNCVWLGLVVLAWSLLFRSAIETSSPSHRRLHSKVSRALLAVLIAAVIWLLKILLVKLLASSFHVATFFDRMKESVFHHYILEALSGPPLDEAEAAHPPPPQEEEKKEYNYKRWRSTPGMVVGGSRREASSRRIDMEKLKRLSRLRATAWGVKRLVSHITRSGLSTMARTVDETMQDFNDASEMSSELEARLTAERVFHHVAGENKKIEVADLLLFLSEEEVQTILPFFERTEEGHIRKSAFRNWVVKAYKERKALAHALNDTRTAVQQLHKLASAVVIVVILVVSVLVMGLATSKVVLVITSQLLLVVFIFGNTCKTIFESIIFVFVMHPFDVGDRCVIDGVQMIVEEMNILTTVFLRFDNEKIFYPNSVLLTKPISNFNRSPEMGDNVEFAIDVKTTAEKINDLKASIKTYIDGKPKHWQQKHSVVAREIEDVNKMKMVLFVQHTMNFQDFPERNNRRSELVLELKRIFENLGIEYHLLPQEVRFSQAVLTTGRMPMQ